MLASADIQIVVMILLTMTSGSLDVTLRQVCLRTLPALNTAGVLGRFVFSKLHH